MPGSFLKENSLGPKGGDVLNSAWFVFLAVETSGSTAFRWGNISDGNGIPIAITGMLIVFSALALITCAIAAIPHILSAIDPFLPAIEAHHQAPRPAESLTADEERVSGCARGQTRMALTT